MTKQLRQALLIFAFGLSVASCNNKKPSTTPNLTSNPTIDNYSNSTSLSNRAKWGAGNVHDPTVIKVDSTYYLYSTDAYYIPNGTNFNDDSIKTGHIQIRSSKDLTHWNFEGWALNNIPIDAMKHIHKHTNNKGADGIWAPYIKKSGNTFRLYYSVSCFGTNASYIGLATSKSPLGPWEDKGCVIKTSPKDNINAIDPSIITDTNTGKEWMFYGSYFGGIYCIELDATTGMAESTNDLGHLVAARSNGKNQIIEAPEIIYNLDIKKYYLFVSYDPLFTHYNLRVGRSDNPEGPFYDYFGNNMADTTNNYPIITHSYMFNNHPGWSGNAHCGILQDGNSYFAFHQGRLAPDNLMMILHVREMKWTSDGWPALSPERYIKTEQKIFNKRDFVGGWEIINLTEIPDNVKLWQGQIPPGGWTYQASEFNKSFLVNLKSDNTTDNIKLSTWKFEENTIIINNTPCQIFNGWDWENERPTILFSGLLENGTAIWGKKVNLTNN